MPGSRAGSHRGTRLAAPQSEIADLIGRGIARPFVAPPCARCKTPLCDSKGNPRWEVVGRLTFVCLGGCPVGPSQRLARKAVLA